MKLNETLKSTYSFQAAEPRNVSPNKEIMADAELAVVKSLVH